MDWLSGYNCSYFTTYHLDRILPTKKTKNKWPWYPSGPYRPTFWFYNIFPGIQTDTTQNIWHIIFLSSSFPFYLNFSALSNTLLKFMIFLNMKQWNILLFLCIFFLTMPLFIKFLNIFNCVEFFMKSSHIFSVGQYLMCTFYFSTWSVIKSYNQRRDSLTWTTFTINLWNNCTLVVLIQYIIVNLVPLPFNK